MPEEPLMNKYLSFGGGINSTALMFYLLDRGEDFEAVYADHGADWPETREYVEMLKNKGFPITVLEARVDGMALPEYCEHYGIIPIRSMRWCTGKFKIRPLREYFKRPAIVYLGFDWGEARRIRPASDEDGIEHRYPLFDAGIDRNDCEVIIRDYGLPVPMKSGCFFCPFQRKYMWQLLREMHPDLWCRVVNLEKRSLERAERKGVNAFYLYGKKPITEAVEAEGQQDLFGWKKPCFCNL